MKYGKKILIVLFLLIVALIAGYSLTGHSISKALFGKSKFQLASIPVTDDEPSRKGECKKYTDESGMACLDVSETWCANRGGTFNGCGSACLFEESAGACIDVCVNTCVIKK